MAPVRKTRRVSKNNPGVSKNKYRGRPVFCLGKYWYPALPLRPGSGLVPVRFLLGSCSVPAVPAQGPSPSASSGWSPLYSRSPYARAPEIVPARPIESLRIFSIPLSKACLTTCESPLVSWQCGSAKQLWYKVCIHMLCPNYFLIPELFYPS